MKKAGPHGTTTAASVVIRKWRPLIETSRDRKGADLEAWNHRNPLPHGRGSYRIIAHQLESQHKRNREFRRRGDRDKMVENQEKEDSKPQNPNQE
jgi:hypothetical protein